MNGDESNLEDILILVNDSDQQVGTMGKEEAHFKGVKHRAFSIFLFNKRQELLIQQRSFSKYHTPGLWANTCCSHPLDGEETLNAAHRRLPFEMGIEAPLIHVYQMAYEAHFDNGVTENEYDHVFLGGYEGDPLINPDEVNDYKWINLDDLKKDMQDNPEKYTFWFKKIIKEFDFISALQSL